uniref:Putative secreted protein n=1 Tax=Anopheles darlingi TaxID=43151 RepID=A0A2M4DP86_ANODA
MAHRKLVYCFPVPVLCVLCLSLSVPAESPAVSVQQSLSGGGSGTGTDRGVTSKATAHDGASTNNSSLIAHIASLPGFDPTKARIVKHYTSKFSTSSTSATPSSSSACPPSTSSSSTNPAGGHQATIHRKPSRHTLTLTTTYNSNSNFSISSATDRERITPTAAESFLPWRRDRSYQNFGMLVLIGGRSASLARIICMCVCVCGSGTPMLHSTLRKPLRSLLRSLLL